MLQRVAALAGVIALSCVATALGEPSRITTPISCGLANGAPWTIVVRASGATRRGSRYYVYETSNLSCSEATTRIARLSRLTPLGLRGYSARVSTGERLHCLTAAVPKEIKQLRPRTAWGWCGTDVARVWSLGVMAAAGTEFFWVTAEPFGRTRVRG